MPGCSQSLVLGVARCRDPLAEEIGSHAAQAGQVLGGPALLHSGIMSPKGEVKYPMHKVIYSPVTAHHVC